MFHVSAKKCFNFAIATRDYCMDQLSSYFKNKFEEKYITCDEGQSLLFLADKKTFQVKIILYTVKTDYSPNETDDEVILAAVNKVLPSTIINPVYQFAARLAKQVEVTFLPIYFPGKTPADGEEHNPPKFVITNPSGTTIGIRDEVTFIKGLHKEIGINPNNEPPKPVNKSVADFFHIWSRDNLACGNNGITKCDLDGMFLNSDNKPAILLEIKRSKKIPAKDWKPYLNDFTGLHLLHNVARECGSELWVIHHGTDPLADEVDIDFKFSLFKITDFDKDGNPKFVLATQPYDMEKIESEINEIIK